MTHSVATRGLLLLSGGFDSPVAGYLARQSGVELSAVHFTANPFFGTESASKTVSLANAIEAKPLYTIDIAPLLSEFSRVCDRRYYFVFMKRVFLRLAQRLAHEKGFDVLITGENLGQVSSQTLSNLAVITSVTPMPIARPLLGFDKQQIVDMAKKIKTHDLSLGPEMCDALGPPKPVTQCTVLQIETQESKIELDTLLESAYQTLTQTN